MRLTCKKRSFLTLSSSSSSPPPHSCRSIHIDDKHHYSTAAQPSLLTFEFKNSDCGFKISSRGIDKTCSD
ncbi:hypothetical protein ACS0TY_016922 [Phlomoides rotata]